MNPRSSPKAAERLKRIASKSFSDSPDEVATTSMDEQSHGESMRKVEGVMGVSQMDGLFNMENPIEMDDEMGYSYDLGDLHLWDEDQQLN